MNMKKRLIILAAAVIVGMAAEARERVNFDKAWKFILADKPEMAQADYDDSGWRTLDVPHDRETSMQVIPVEPVVEHCLEE